MDAAQLAILPEVVGEADLHGLLGQLAGEVATAVPVVPNADASPSSAKALLIRRGRAEDREGLRALLRQLHANSVFRAQAFSDRKFDAQFDYLAQHPDHILALAAEYRGAIVGAAWAQCNQYMLSEGPPFIAVQLIAVEQEALNPVGRAKVFLGLLAAVRQWQTDKGASHVQVNVTTGTNLAATDRLLRKVGAAFVGGSYVV